MDNQKLAMVAECMDQWLRTENHIMNWRHVDDRNAVGFYIQRIRVLEQQLIALNQELEHADTIIFDANARAWELADRNELLLMRIQELDAEMTPLASTEDSQMSDTESEELMDQLFPTEM